MQERQVIDKLLRLGPSPHAPEIKVYCSAPSPRLEAVLTFVFGTALQCRFQIITSQAPDSGEEAAVVYASAYTGNLLHIPASGFLNEKGISPFVPELKTREGLPVFFLQTSEFGFDLFSAIFYFISRYEEYQTFERDEHGRFELSNSLLYKHGLHCEPLLERWCQYLGEKLREKFPTLTIPGREFQVISSIDVDNLFAFRHKSFLRSSGAAFKDVLKGNWLSFIKRLKVLSGAEKDPFDIYDEVGNFCFEHHLPLFCFFLMRSGTRYDRSVHPRSIGFKSVLKQLESSHAICGLHPSYDVIKNPKLLEQEINNLREAGLEKVFASRQHFLRFDILHTPALLQSRGIRYDFTMGFASGPGFRAGTSLPFYWYNFEKESREDFVFVPFCAMDGVWSVYAKDDAGKAYEELKILAEGIKAYKGIFMTVFHERSFSDHLYPGFGNLYKKIHAEVSAFSKD